MTNFCVNLSVTSLTSWKTSSNYFLFISLICFLFMQFCKLTFFYPPDSRTFESMCYLPHWPRRTANILSLLEYRSAGIKSVAQRRFHYNIIRGRGEWSENGQCCFCDTKSLCPRGPVRPPYLCPLLKDTIGFFYWAAIGGPPFQACLPPSSLSRHETIKLQSLSALRHASVR